MNNRHNIYADLDEKFVKTVMIYGNKATGGYAFYDAAMTTKIPKDELFELFLKGATVLVSGQYYKAVSFKDNTIDAEIILVGESTFIVLNSAEHRE